MSQSMLIGMGSHPHTVTMPTFCQSFYTMLLPPYHAMRREMMGGDIPEYRQTLSFPSMSCSPCSFHQLPPQSLPLPSSATQSSLHHLEKEREYRRERDGIIYEMFLACHVCWNCCYSMKSSNGIPQLRAVPGMPLHTSTQGGHTG